MTEIVVKLTPSADTSFLKKAIENMRGVFSTYIREVPKKSVDQNNDWLEKLHALKNDINPDVIDFSDDKTNYIMSK